MKYYRFLCISFVVLAFGFFGCGKKIKLQEDKLYSRHLQVHIPLTIISTPMGDEPKNMHLLLLNDGESINQLRVKEIVDSLQKKGLIQPLLIVAIHTTDRLQQYGVSDKPDINNNGTKAENYANFIENELLPYVKKNTGIRKFASVTIAGCSLGGLSAFDIAWNHADKIDKVGVFSGSFWWRDKNITDTSYSDATNRIMLSSVKSSRKKPHLQYWFYTGMQEEAADRDKDGIIDVVDDTKDLIAIIKAKKVCPDADIKYVESPTGKHDYASWTKVFPDFLLWVAGK